MTLDQIVALASTAGSTLAEAAGQTAQQQAAAAAAAVSAAALASGATQQVADDLGARTLGSLLGVLLPSSNETNAEGQTGVQQAEAAGAAAASMAAEAGMTTEQQITAAAVAALTSGQIPPLVEDDLEDAVSSAAGAAAAAAAAAAGQDIFQQAAAAGAAAAGAITQYFGGSQEEQALAAAMAAAEVVAAAGGSVEDQIQAAAAAVAAQGASDSLTLDQIASLLGQTNLPRLSAESTDLMGAGVMWGLIATAVGGIAVILAVVSVGKMQKTRLKQAQALRQATEEAKLAERMQDNFDATRAKICVMLPKLEPGQGVAAPTQSRFQSVLEGKKDFNFADDVLPGEREAPQDTFRGSHWGEDTFSLELGNEVISGNRNSTSSVSRLPASPPATASAIQNDFWTAPEVGDDELPTIKPSAPRLQGGPSKLQGDDERFSVGKVQPPFSPTSGLVSPSGRRSAKTL